MIGRSRLGLVLSRARSARRNPDVIDRECQLSCLICRSEMVLRSPFASETRSWFILSWSEIIDLFVESERKSEDKQNSVGRRVGTRFSIVERRRKTRASIGRSQRELDFLLSIGTMC